MTVAIPTWLIAWMQKRRITLWNVADLGSFECPQDETGRSYPRAFSIAIPMNPHIMAGIQNGPNQSYADEYARVNHQIKSLSNALGVEIASKGYQAHPIAASERTDTINIRGDFPHKTAATRAGLGWIGRHCQLITREFGSWVRLGTVFTDMALPGAIPRNRNYCGRCTRCVDACPAKALTGKPWHPGVPREAILDVAACDRWKKKHYRQYHNGHNCGICSAVCPYGLKVLHRKKSWK